MKKNKIKVSTVYLSITHVVVMFLHRQLFALVKNLFVPYAAEHMQSETEVCVCVCVQFSHPGVCFAKIRSNSAFLRQQP